MNIFLDANVILDKFDSKRPFYKDSILIYEYLILNHKIFITVQLNTYK